MDDCEFGNLANLARERRWRGQAYPAPIVVALIRRRFHQGDSTNSDDHYLLIRRNQSPYDGQWALVGGKWDFGETLEGGIIREVKEETDLDVAFVAVRGLVSERVVTGETEQQGAHFLILVCEVTAADNGQAKERDEGAVEWFSCEQIDTLHESGTIIPSDYAMIRSFVRSNDGVPYVEAEMRAQIVGQSNDPVHLIRFERIEGRN